MADTDNNIISSEEYKKATEELYKRNLELARLYKEVDSLNHELGTANQALKDLIVQRESLVHLITHKVKGAFTHSKYTFAGIIDGTFGEVNAEVKMRAQQGLESDDAGIKTVDLVLNASNLQKGAVKYEMKKLDLKELLSKIISEKKVQAEAKNLKIEDTFPTDAFETNGDVFWLKEAISNLLENSIKYTKAGSITIGLEKKDKGVMISVKDTGIGLSEEDKKILFTEGGRGKDSVKVNVDSTGYGLYSVKLIIDAHGGKVWAESTGPNQGSTFLIELPALA